MHHRIDLTMGEVRGYKLNTCKIGLHAAEPSDRPLRPEHMVNGRFQ